MGTEHGTGGNRIVPGQFARLMLWSSFALAVGSFFLLIGSLGLNTPFSVGLAVLYSIPALLSHSVAWLLLGWATIPRKDDLPARTRMVAAFLASIVGFLVGLAILSFLAPDIYLRLIADRLFPYYPPVFVPVVVAHALLFRYSTSVLSDPSDVLRVRIGTLALLVVASIGALFVVLLALFGGTLPELLGGVAYRVFVVLFFSLSGMTSLGYGLVAGGWGQAYKRFIRSSVSPV